MTKREMVLEVVSLLKTEQKDIDFIVRNRKKELIEKWYKECQRVKENQLSLRKGSTLKDWQIFARWMMMNNK